MIRRPFVLAASLSIALLACSSTTRTSSPDPTGPRPTTAGSTTATAVTTTGSSTGSTAAPGSASTDGKGWIGGEPSFSASDDKGRATAGGVVPASARPAGAESATGDSSATADGMTEPKPGSPVEQSNKALRAGSVDDNAAFDEYLGYLARYRQLGAPERAFDPSGRVVISVHGANGLPSKGVPVVVSADGETIAHLRTDAIGRAIFLPGTYGSPHSRYRVEAASASADTTPGTAVDLRLAADGGAAPGMAVDVLFLLDVTGSMGDEINQLKTTIAAVSSQLEELPQHPDIRFGMTLFRDQGDAFVTSTFDLTNDLASFQAALNDVVAGGGGDTPEAVDEGFAAALNDPTWRDPATTTQMIFLVGDAAPHIERQLDQAYPQSIHVAAERGITVNVVAASSTDDPAEHAFRAISEGTGGRFVFLAYGAGGAALGENTDIKSTDYEELSLDDLVVRLVSEQLAALTGTPSTPPATTSDTAPTVPPTNPPGQ